jgi:hypothetical protein
MFDQLSARLNRLADGRIVLILFVLDMLFNVVIMPFAGTLFGGPNNVGPFDLLFGFSPEQAQSMLAAYGPQGRVTYALVDASLDVIYPIVYTLFFSLAITFLFRYAFGEGSPLLRAQLLPFGAIVFDYLENIAVITMLFTFPAVSPTVVAAASAVNRLKWLFAGASIIAVLIGLVAALVKRARGK